MRVYAETPFRADDKTGLITFIHYTQGRFALASVDLLFEHPIYKVLSMLSLDGKFLFAPHRFLEED